MPCIVCETELMALGPNGKCLDISMCDANRRRRFSSVEEKVNHPRHYNAHPSGIEAIVILEYMNFCRGNAIKYLWRAGEKGDELEDLKKSAWYLTREIERIEKERAKTAESVRKS